MLTANSYMTRPAFAERCREVRADLDGGVPMSLGDIADRLGLSFDEFVHHLAAEIFRQAPDVGGVLVCDAEKVTLQ